MNSNLNSQEVYANYAILKAHSNAPMNTIMPVLPVECEGAIGEGTMISRPLQHRLGSWSVPGDSQKLWGRRWIVNSNPKCTYGSKP